MANDNIRDILGLIPGYDPFRDGDGYLFDDRRAARAVDFIEQCLCLVEGEWAGKPFLLEPWQKAIVANLFGWVTPAGLRRYREVFVYVPRKNAKTTLASALVLSMLFLDNEPGAQTYCAAADTDQANLLFSIAKRMVERSPLLAERCRIFRHSIQMIDPRSGQETGSFFKVISSDANTKHGFSAHCCVVDELHAHPNSELVDVLETSMGARRQPLMIHLTTADFIRDSMCNAKHKRACMVRDGVAKDARFLPVIYEAKTTDDWADLETWKKANPNYGVSIKEDFIDRMVEQARNFPSERNKILRLHLNVQTDTSESWIDWHQWSLCASAELAEEDVGHLPCYLGVDLSRNDDTTSVVKLFVDDRDSQPKCYVFPEVWVPQVTANKREMQGHVSYLSWIRDGHMRACRGEVINHDDVQQFICECVERYDVQSIMFDPHDAKQVSTRLKNMGYPVGTMGPGVSQMSSPSKLFERMVSQRQITHTNQPVMNWMIRNTMIDHDNFGNIRPSKKHSTGKIDAVIATVIALGAWELADQSPSIGMMFAVV